jgi:hypothetical protein
MKKAQKKFHWKPGGKRKFYDPSGRGWIMVYWNVMPRWARNNPKWRAWSMSVVRKNGASYWTVNAMTRKQLPGLMRLEIALKKDPTMKQAHEALTGAKKKGKQTKRMDNPFATEIDHGQW